jgi:putative copper resistance protein D
MGGPMTLALRALTPAGRGNPPGLREWIAVGIGSRFLRVVLHPLVVLALFVGSFYALYLTGLFDIALRYHWAHQLMNLHFLVIGYLFFWPLIGVDASPTRLPHIGRLAVLLAAMPFHAFFGVAVMSTSTVLGGEFYRLLALPWVGNLLDDQHTGGGIAWAAGEAPMLLVILVLLQRWSRDDAREAARHDRRADADGEADLEAYNAMLARMSGSERS